MMDWWIGRYKADTYYFFKPFLYFGHMQHYDTIIKEANHGRYSLY